MHHVLSFFENTLLVIFLTLECRKGTHIIRADPNDAESGAEMLTDFVLQATKNKIFLSAQPSPRYVTVWLGHNDVCAGTIEKIQTSCAKGNDQDPHNYCRTTPAAFEREFRKGLDILITVPHLKVGVASLIRASQLCNHDSEKSCTLLGGSLTCEGLWKTATISGPVFGLDHGICGSLTMDCSDQRISDAYETAKTYHDILANVTTEYDKIAEGEASHVVTIGGETVGGATKATGVRLDFSATPWVYKFRSEEISCCDCFHPSKVGQNNASRILFDGFTCGSSDVCCADVGDALSKGLCATEDTSGTFFSGLF